MPRIARSNAETALSKQNSENVGNITSIKGKSLPEKQTRGSNNLKRPAEKTVNPSEYNAKTRRRAALGEITNVSKTFNIVDTCSIYVYNWGLDFYYTRVNLIAYVKYILGQIRSIDRIWREGVENFEKPNEERIISNC